MCAALVLLLTMMPGAALSVSATTMSAITSDKIKEMESQIDAAEAERNQLKSNVSDLKKITKELEALKGNLTSYVTALDRNVAEMKANIAVLQGKITDKEAEIVLAQQELREAEEIAASQYESMRIRIRFMYENNVLSSILDAITTAGSLGRFLNMADRIDRIYSYDQEKWEEYQLHSEYVRLCKEELELEKEILDGQKKSVEEEQNHVETLIAEKQQEIVKYQTDINTKEAAIAEYEADIKMQDEIIAQLEQAVTDEKKQILLENGLVLAYDGGKFTFPMESYTRMSSDYGWRIHPTLGVNKFHNGIDFAAPEGTAIYAAYDGIVVASAYNSSMGNYVMINHGNGVYTIYMHASKLIAKEGEIVMRGTKIAEVGTTGRSTGNHLHFGVRLNGAYVSPWDYLP